MTATSTESPRLPDRFQIDREIGRGATAVVYRAQDQHLDRFVAIKVLSEGISSTFSAERFQREISLMAKLVHPGIVALFDSGETDDRLYYVMPLVSGETLRARLAREHRVTPHDGAALGADIAEALAYAHGMGIVHRDVKPENIFAVDGRAVLADFGIARLFGESTAGALTSTGMVLGTAAYMSPEQAGGEADLDGRSDLYSLGCVLYELLTGVPPFVANTYMAMIGKHMTEEPKTPSSRGVALPAGLDDIVMRLLAKEREERPASAGEVARMLRAASQTNAMPVYAPARVESLNVSSIEISATDHECSQLATEVTQAVAASLCALPGLRVTQGRDVTGTSVHGSMRRAGNRVRITMRVSDPDGTLRWSKTTDGALDDPFGLEDSVAEGVATHFAERTARGVTRATSDADQLVAEGVAAFRMFGAAGGAAAKSHLDEAKVYLTRALAIDPRNARGLCALGNLLYVSGVIGVAPREESTTRGRELIFEALAADDQVAEVHCSMGKIALYHDDDFHAAARHIRRAIELDPFEPEAQRLMSIVYKILGRADDAVNAAMQATTREPSAAPLWNALADSLLAAGRNAEAIDALRRAISLLPGYGPALERLELAHHRLGEFDRAIEIRSSRMRLAGQRERADLLDAEGSALGGAEAIRRDVRRELEKLLAQSQTMDPFFDHVGRNVGDRIVSAYAELGEWREAMDWVERAYERRPGRMRRMLADLPVDYRGLAVDPRYARLMRAAGLENLI